MKFSIDQSSLLDSLKIVSRAVSGTNTLPVLGNVLIRTQGKKVFFSATNLEISISTSVEADIQNEGAITVPAKILTSYTSLLGKNDDIELSLIDGATLQVKSKRSKTKIKGISADEFPEIKTVDAGTKLSLGKENFRSAVHKVGFAAQENSSRPILSGVYFNAKKDELRMAATDSYRLSEQLVKLDAVVDDTTCVIPVRAVLEADRLASKTEAEIKITIGENQVMFTVGTTYLTSRLIDGKFPDYNQIIPKKSSTTVTLNRSEYEMAVRRVSIFAKENNQHMRIQVLADGTFEVSTSATEIGEEKTTLQVKVEGTANEIALNADYVLDVIGALSGEESIQLELDTKMTPAVFRSTSGSGFIHLIMPLKM